MAQSRPLLQWIVKLLSKNFSKQINASDFNKVDELYQNKYIQIQTISNPSEDKVTSVTFIESSSH